jgi:hypothetical protein
MSFNDIHCLRAILLLKFLLPPKVCSHFQAFNKASTCLTMARIRTTVRLGNEGEATYMIETASISEVMREPDIAEPSTREEVSTSGKSNYEAQGEAEFDGDEEDPNILCPSKPSHIELGNLL